MPYRLSFYVHFTLETIALAVHYVEWFILGRQLLRYTLNDVQLLRCGQLQQLYYVTIIIISIPGTRLKGTLLHYVNIRVTFN